MNPTPITINATKNRAYTVRERLPEAILVNIQGRDHIAINEVRTTIVTNPPRLPSAQALEPLCMQASRQWVTVTMDESAIDALKICCVLRWPVTAVFLHPVGGMR